MIEGVLQSVGQLVGIDIPETVLNVGIHDKLRQTQYLPGQMERIQTSSSSYVPSRGEGLRWINQQVQHVVALPADLQPDLDRVQFGTLEELVALRLLNNTFLCSSLTSTWTKSDEKLGFKEFTSAFEFRLRFNKLT